MKLREVKNWINGLSEDELDNELLYNSNDHYISGVVSSINKAEEDMIYVGDDDPSQLYTYNDFINKYGEYQIGGDYVSISKGEYYLDLD